MAILSRSLEPEASPTIGETLSLFENQTLKASAIQRMLHWMKEFPVIG